MLANGDNDFTKGGIDLNPNNLELGSSGDKIQMKVSDRFLELQNVTVDGFVPVIINIVPVNNLPLILGGVDLQDSVDEPTNSVQQTPPNVLESDPELLTRLLN